MGVRKARKCWKNLKNGKCPRVPCLPCWTIMEKAGKCHRAPCHPFSFSKELLKACNAFKKLLNRLEKARLVPLKSKSLHKALHIALGLRDQERLFVSSKPAAAATTAATAAAATSAACATPAHIAYVRMHACMYIPLLRCYLGIVCTCTSNHSAFRL